MNLQIRLLLEWLAIALLASLAVVAASEWRGTAAFDNLIYDQLAGFDRPEAGDDILIVAIDDPSLAAIGKWPWARDVHADAINRLKAAEPRSLTVDILFSEKSDEARDNALADAVARGPASFLPLHFVTPGGNGREYDTELPIAQLAEVAAGIGHVNLEFDRDGSVRRAALCFTDSDGKQWPHLMELVYRGDRTEAPSPVFERLPCDQPTLFSYAPRGSFAEVSIANVLSGEIPAGLIRGRDVIIGATAIGMGDSYPVPFTEGGVMSGSEIMANMLNALRRDTFVRPIDGMALTAISLTPLWLLMLIFLFAPPRTALIASVVFLALILLGSATLMGMQIWVAPGSALIGILLTYPLWGWRRLQAVSSFMDRQLGKLESDSEIARFTGSVPAANDLVGRQSAALGSAITQIRDLRRFVSDVLSDLPDPMVVTNLSGQITLASDLVTTWLGRDVAGEQFSQVMLSITSEGQRSELREFLEIPVDNIDPKSFIRFTTLDGRSFVMRQSAARSDDGRPVGRISYLADISALAEAESQREEVLQLLSHDMRAPQSAIIASLEGELDDAARGRIARNAQRTMRLAQDFVDMARMGETDFEGQDVLLAELAREVMDNLWPLAKEQGVEIRIEEKADEVFVLAEPEQLSRAISNLLDNAVKFSEPGGIITVTLRRTEIANERTVSLAITDQGPGINEEILSNLFDRFVTSDNTSRRAQGTGLGLAYVEAVVRRHGGDITAANAAGQGAVFTMTLPEAPDYE